MLGGEPDYLTGDLVGPDLHATHPVSFTYDATLANADGALENPTTCHIGDTKSDLTVNLPLVPPSWAGISLTGKSIDQAMLFNHKLESSSCHDVHKLQGSAPSYRCMLKHIGTDVRARDDLLCRTCHIK